MIKRMNKVTSLLVAAAAMVSIVPANAADKLAIKEGTIENAIAFDGGYVFHGYKNDEDDNGVYFNNGNKDTILNDIDDVDKLYTYGTKYVVAQDGRDQYMIDMSTGKVSDEDTAEDLESTIKTKLNSSLRKTERYENAGDEPVETVSKISKGFSEVWYKYSATTSAAHDAEVVYGYSNQSGKYIDASVTANLYVVVGSDRVKIEEFGDTEKVGNGDSQKAVTVNLTDAEPITIGDDSSYIYRIVEVEVAVTGEDSYNAYYLQKISKAQGDKEKEAYLPKSVESYLIDVENGKAYVDNKDVKKATDLLFNDENELEINPNNIRVVDGSIYVVNWTTSKKDEIKVTKLVLKRNEKIKVNDTDKVDYSVVKYSDDVEEDADDFTFDVNGNVWTIYNGKISKSVKGGDFEVVYTCDRTLDKLNVYNDGSLIAWEENGEVYTTVQEGKEAAKNEAEEVVGGETTVTKTGWDLENGVWYLYDATGAKLTGWQNVGGTWYYMDPTTAAMRTGWLNDNGTWYYLQSSGAMKTGWLLDGTTWYYMNANGSMATGWLNDNGTWYYLNGNGSMAANTTVGGYVLGANGAWIR